jgi:hypothetical protein
VNAIISVNHRIADLRGRPNDKACLFRQDFFDYGKITTSLQGTLDESSWAPVATTSQKLFLIPGRSVVVGEGHVFQRRNALLSRHPQPVLDACSYRVLILGLENEAAPADKARSMRLT